MKIALIGATGRAGSRLAAELLARGHSITGIVRQIPTDIPAGVTIVQADTIDPDALAPPLEGHDAVQRAKVTRLLVVGGAGSLEVAPGKALMDAEGFPEAFRTEAAAGGRFLAKLRSEPGLDWTFLSPSADFAPGERTGRFRLGDDRLLSDAQGESHISMEDFAIAMVDELERPAHSRRRFTVGY